MVKQEQKDLVFFTKKKIILITLGIFIFGLFIFLIYKYFFEIEFSIIFTTISEAFQQNKLFFLWLSLLIGFPVFASFWRI